MGLSIYNHCCNRCKLSERIMIEGGTVCVEGVGPVPADIMLVGEAPGSSENKGGQPFIGAAGQQLNALLEQAGLSREQIFVTNVVKCQPQYNATPTKREQAACAIYTIQEIRQVQPRVIIALGGTPLEALTGYTSVGTNRGKILSLKPEYRSDVPVLVTWHPASLLHDPSKKEQRTTNIIADFAFARRIIEGEQPKYQAYTDEDEETARNVLRRIAAESPYIASDTEYQVINDGPWPWSRRDGATPQLLVVGVAGQLQDGRIVGVAVRPESPLFKGVKNLLERKPVVFHNAMADLLWLFSIGVKVKLGGDTMVMGSLLCLDESKSLEALTALYTDFQPGWKGAVKKRTKVKNLGDDDLLGRIPESTEEWHTLLDYNAKDCMATVALHEALAPLFNHPIRQRTVPLYKQVILPSITHLAKAALTGVPMDVQLIKTMEQEAREVIARTIHEIGEHLGITSRVIDIVTSPQKLGQRLLEQGIALPVDTKGHTSVTLDRLRDYRDTHPVARPLMRLKSVEKNLTSYLRPWRELLDEQGDGRIHTIYKLGTVRTGRTGSEMERGNTMQQFPRESTTSGMKRTVRAQPGRSFLIGDLSQIELRLVAFVSREPTMLDAYRRNIDLHTTTAAWIKARSHGLYLPDFLANRDEWMAEVTKAERNNGKVANFSLVYGGSEYILINEAKKMEIDLSIEEATQIRTGFFSLYTGLNSWHESCWKYVRQGWVPTPTGRFRVLDGKDELSSLRQAINCVDFETEALTKRGWVKGPDLKLNDEILTKNAETGELEWQRPTDLKVFPDYKGRFVEISSKTFNALTTPDHRWLIYDNLKGKDRCVTSETLNRYGHHRIHRTGNYRGQSTSIYSDDFVELVGWVLTDGYLAKSSTQKTNCIVLVQSERAKPENVARIDRLLSRMKIKSERNKIAWSEVISWQFTGVHAELIRSLFPNRTLTTQFLSELTRSQAEILFETMMLGDGTTGAKDTFHTDKKEQADAFQILCTMTGKASSLHYRAMSGYSSQSKKTMNVPSQTGYWVVNILRRDKAQVVKHQYKEFEGEQGVWCPIVPNTYFVARRRGQVCITGNTPIQSAASDIALAAMVYTMRRLEEAGLSSRVDLLGFVHDALMFEVDSEVEDTVAAIVYDSLVDPPLKEWLGLELDVPLEADIEYGPSWGEVKKWKPAVAAR